jgi:hypothetical protein
LFSEVVTMIKTIALAAAGIAAWLIAGAIFSTIALDLLATYYERTEQDGHEHREVPDLGQTLTGIHIDSREEMVTRPPPVPTEQGVTQADLDAHFDDHRRN